MHQLPYLNEYIIQQKKTYNDIINQLKIFPEIRICKPVTSDAILGNSLLFQLTNSSIEKTTFLVEALRAEGIDCWYFNDEKKQSNARCYWNWRFLFED